ncbi:MAG TPA: sugar ABC transporter ATP-binding protein [Candidatus Limnocylindrales bacterium]|nr:sugar ABC transporter ATP-binding protein [Candidatus Limnocylindrales bacterium]
MSVARDADHAEREPTASQAPLLRMEQIDKRYPGVHALDHVDFELRRGEVHVLLGENGAGKSTLVKILSGSLAPDSGRIVIDDREMAALTPERAAELGIGMVYQELSLVPALSVAENIFLGQPPRNRLGLVAWPEMVKRAQASLDELGVDIDPRVEVRSLEVARQQLTEIARVLARRPKIVLLDEPTSALSDAERERLFETIGRMAASGVGIVYISHRLAEVPLIGQRVTVLRDGRVAGSLPVEQADEDTMVQMMVGRSVGQPTRRKPVSGPGRELLRVEDLSVPDALHGVSLEVHEGEVLGIFGLMGAGQYELSRAIFGLEKDVSGSIFIEGRKVEIADPRTAIANGLGLLTRDRRAELVPMQPIPANITLARVGQRRVWGLLDGDAESRAAAAHVEDLGIQPPYLDRPVMHLSGGNQQKVVLARWLHSEAKILIFDEPTRGVDVGAKAEVFALMTDLLQKGVGVMMISSEMPELLEMADRIVVMRGGRIAAELDGQRASQEELLRRAS